MAGAGVGLIAFGGSKPAARSDANRELSPVGKAGRAPELWLWEIEEDGTGGSEGGRGVAV
jgi:hypothetical protein